MGKINFKKWANVSATILTILGIIGPFSFQGIQIASAIPGNTIYGVIKTSSNVAVTTATICAYPSANFTNYENQCGSTDGSGAFLFTVNEAGATYTYNIYVNDDNDVAPAAATFIFNGSNIDLGTINLVAPSVRGIVRNPDGSAASSANLMIHDFNFSHSYATSTNSDGIFKGGILPTGSYFIDVMPATMTGGILAQRNIPVAVTLGSTNTDYVTTPIQLIAAKKTITGTVTLPNGTPVSNATVYAFSMDGAGGQGNADTDVNGHYTMLVGRSKYGVNATPKMDSGPATWGYFDAPVMVYFVESDAVSESQTVNIVVTNYDATITGRLVYPGGAAVNGGAMVSAMIAGGYGSSMSSTVDGNGYFAMGVVSNNTYQINVNLSNNQYGTPEIPQVTVSAGETKNIGNITLEAKTSIISGQVTDTNGMPLANKMVNAFKSSGIGWSNAQTDESGNYSIYVNSGSWFVDVLPGTEVPGGMTSQYVKTQAPQKIIISENQTRSNINFQLTLADATITGTVVDTDGNVLSSINTFAYANDVNRTVDTHGQMMGFSDLGSQVSNGIFTLHVPAGTYQIGVTMPPGSNYTPSTNTTYTVTTGQNYSGASITLLPNDAAITGSLKDSSGNILSRISGQIFADNGQGAHQMAQIENGTYSLSVAAGNWRLGTMINPGSGYVAGKLNSSSIVVAANSTVTNDITLLKVDSVINVNVVDPNGQPLRSAWVSANNELAGRQISAEQSGMFGAMFNQGSATDANGSASIRVPAGSYFVTATLPADQGYIFPAAQQITVSAATPGTAQLQFRQSDGTISGTVSRDNSASAAYVSAWSEDGAFSEVSTSDGHYSLNVMKDQTWHVSAAFETSASFYQSSEYSVVVPASGTASQNLDLILSDITVSPPETSNFDSTKSKIMTLVDGTTIEMPAYSLALNGNVTVTATPKGQGVPRTASAKPIALAYDLEVKDANGRAISTFQSDVTITLKYTSKQLSDLGITADQISPMYYDITTGTWKTVNNIVLDTVNKKISFTTSHFTNFAITTAGATEVVGTNVDEAPVSTALSLVTIPKTGAPQVRIFNQNGKATGTFYAFNSNLRGEFGVITSDIDGDDHQEIIAYTGSGFSPKVRVFDYHGKFISQFYAYPQLFRGGVDISAADVNGDGKAEIITKPKQNGGANIKIFKYDNTDKSFETLDSLWPFPASFSGRMNLTAVDINGNGTAEIIVAPRENGRPKVKVYQYNSQSGKMDVLDQFMAYAEKFDGGVNVAAANVSGDTTKEIVVSPVANGGPHIRIYQFNARTGKFGLKDQFMAYSTGYVGGVEVKLVDINNDGLAEIISAPTKGGPNIRVYQYNTTRGKFVLLGGFTAYAAALRGGVNVTSGDIDGDDINEIIVSPKTNGGPHVRVYKYNNQNGKIQLFAQVIAHASQYRGQMQIQTADLNGDGHSEIITSLLTPGGPNVKIINFTNSKLKVSKAFSAYAAGFVGGVQTTTVY